ncbi:TorF family putative porin [Flocculibacter collagenilyticus]|uniref:TorF family putative porin n=1 Tax=Flocculibacter collagenilyticus TaxID=2744479 RepID=UPI0018F6F9C6|nr:TorF family putative porin [Flocculibacter collagenilyticus]
MKLTILGVLASSLLMSSFSANAELSGNFGITSNYLWRGVSQSDDNPSVSGGLDYKHEKGFYAGAWLGSVKFGDDSGTEIDTYLGFSKEMGEASYDVGYIYYAYPAEAHDDINFGELYFKGAYKGLSYGVAYTINSDAKDDETFAEGDMYYYVGYEFELSQGFNLALTYGYYNFDENEAIAGDNDYRYIQADLSKDDFVFTVSKADEESGDDDTKFAVSWSKTF